MCSAIVLSPSRTNYRRVAQLNWGLTDDQMLGMQVHHHPPVHLGGRNIPEHLYVCSPEVHQHGWHSDEFFVLQAGKSSGNKTAKRGRPPKKKQPSERDLQVYKLRSQGLSSTEIGEILGISRNMAKKSYAWCVKLGMPQLPDPKPGPPKNCQQRGGNPTGKNQFKK